VAEVRDETNDRHIASSSFIERNTMHRPLHKMPIAIITSMIVVLGLVAPASADTIVRDVERPVRVERPDRVDRPTDVAVLSIGCHGRTTDDGNKAARCRWSSTENVRAYQLWRIVDRGHRELVGTYNNDTNVARNDVPDDAVLVRYAVVALDADGDIIGRSRLARVRFRQHDGAVDRVTERPTDRVTDRENDRRSDRRGVRQPNPKRDRQY
jgi:hypothetical protein